MHESLAQTVEGFLDAWSRLDAEAVGAYFTEASRALWLGQPIVEGCEAIQRSLGEAFSHPGLWTELRLFEVSELVPGRVGYSIAEYTSGTGEPGQAPSHEGKFVAIWERGAEAGWQVVVHSSSPDELLS